MTRFSLRSPVLALVFAVTLSVQFFCPAASSAGSRDTVTVFAAASLKTALDEVAKTYVDATGNKVLISYAGSSALARQIEQGAPAQLFISANPGWMDRIEQAGFVADGTRRDLLGNRLVLVASGDVSATLKIDADMDLAQALGQGRLAMALVKAVPAGIYGQAALQSLGVWADVEDKVVQADNVRAALLLVALGEAPMGVVYATDAMAESRVQIVDTFPEDTHPPIVYPMAVIAEGDTPAARAFADYLSGPKAAAMFASHGFTEPGGGS